MAELTRQGSAQWNGDLKTGQGHTSTGSGSLNELPYSVPSRFESAKGTNPEEMLAAAHASCFSMMLAKVLGDEKKTARELHTKATITLAQRGGGWKITKVHLENKVKDEGLDADAVQRE